MKADFEFLPQSIKSLHKGYSLKDLLADSGSGVTVAIIALPLAMALAIASGVAPERGLYTAIVAGFLISLLGGSRLQIGGPTGAFIVIVFDIVQRYGYAGLATATLMAGFFLIAFALARFGNLIKFIPYPVTTGFTSGIALVIFTSQLGDFFGLKIEKLPADFLLKLEVYIDQLGQVDARSTLIGLSCLFTLMLLRSKAPRLPATLLVVLLSSFVVFIFDLPVQTIGSRFGDLPRSLPSASFNFDFSQAMELIPEALTIALLAGIESLLSALVADGMSGDRHNSNCELLAQGVANIASVIFGGIPATGAIARTAANIKAGARSPFSGMIHALSLLAFMLLFAPLARYIPLPALAAILFMVAWNMSEFHHFKALLKAPRSDVMVLLTTFLLTVFVDLTVAIQVGVVLAALLFMKRMSEVSDHFISASKLSGSMESNEDEAYASDLSHIPPEIEVFEINGPFFFGVVDTFKSALERIETPPKILIIRMRRVSVMDATAIHALREFLARCKRNHTRVMLSGLKKNVASKLENAGILKEIGASNVFKNISLALEEASRAAKSAQEQGQ